MSDLEREFQTAAIELGRLTFLLAAEQAREKSSGEVHEAVALLWTLRRSGLAFREEHPAGDAHQAWRIEYARMIEEIKLLVG